MQVVFADEKKWNLDGPDGYHSYWHDIRREPHYFSTRPFGGGSVMTWIGFSRSGKLAMAFTSNRMNSKDYQQVLEIHLLPFFRGQKRRQFSYAQDNASIHVSEDTLAWFKSKKIPLVDWPACSPDMNPTENLFGILTRDVFANGRQYKSVKELKEALLRSCSNISQQVLDNLVASMENRIFELIKARGSYTRY